MKDEAEIMEQLEDLGLLAKCPFCGYSLFGLPTKHACPECGQYNDRRGQVFGGRSIWGIRQSGYELYVGTVVLCLIMALVLLFISPSLATMRVLSCVMVALCALQLWLVFYRPSRFLAVGPDELAICNRRRNHQSRYTWERIGSAEICFCFFCFRLEIDWCNRTFLVFRFGLLVPSELRHCIAHINDMRSKAGAAAKTDDSGHHAEG